MAYELVEHVNQHAATLSSLTFARQISGQSTVSQIDYKSFHDLVSGWVRELDRRIEPGCTTLLYGQNSIDFLIAFTAILASGRIAFPVHPHLTDEEVQRAVHEANAESVITARPNMAGLGSRECDVIDLTSHPEPCSKPLDPQRAESAGLYLQSSGTTGLPKIIHRKAKALDAVARTLTQLLMLTHEDRILAVIPMCHSYGVENVLLAPLYSGARLHIAQGFSLDATLSQFQNDGVTIFPSVPFVFESLANVDFKTTDLLRHVYSAGAPLPTTVQSLFHERFGAPIEHLYGASEVGTITFNPHESAVTAPNSVGKVVPGVEIRVLDIEHPDTQLPLASGEIGQLAVSSDAMLSEYIGSQKEDLEQGFFLTGDLGYIDEHGFLYLTGRAKLQIDVGGLKVNPLEVEQELLKIAGVKEAVVIPLPVTSTLSRLRAVIVTDDQARPLVADDVRDHLRKSLAPHKIPRVIEFHKSLPRSPTGKILRREVPAPCE